MTQITIIAMMMTKVAAATGTTRFKFARRNVKGDSALLSVMSLGGEIVPETFQVISLVLIRWKLNFKNSLHFGRQVN